MDMEFSYRSVWFWHAFCIITTAMPHPFWAKQTQDVSNRNNDVPKDKEVEVLPICHDPLTFEHDCRSNSSDSARLKGFSPQLVNGSFSSLNGERIAVELWFRSRVARVAFLKRNSIREQDHA